jgi:hypothetical protein
VSEIRGVRHAAVLEFFRAHVPNASDVGYEFAHLGQLHMNDGVWNDQRLLPEDTHAAMRAIVDAVTD